MTAPEPTPTAEHIDAVAVEFEHVVVGSGYYAMNIGTTAACEAAREILTSDNPETHAALAASLPAEVKIASLTDAEMLAALVDRGTLTAEDAPIARHGGYEHTHWQQRWDGQHTHEGRRFVTSWEVAE
jgi:hypothetical protein